MKTLPYSVLQEITQSLMPSFSFEKAIWTILYDYIDQKLQEWTNREQVFAQNAGVDYVTYEQERADEWDSEDIEKVRRFNEWTTAYSQVLKYTELKQKCETYL